MIHKDTGKLTNITAFPRNYKRNDFLGQNIFCYVHEIFMCHVFFEKYVTIIQDISKTGGICEMSE